MAGAPRVQVTGAKELRKALRHMGADLKDMQKTNKAAAKVVAVRGREIAPRLSGALAGSTRETATQKEGAVLAGSRSVPYAGPIHFGWPKHNIEPNPFLYDAADQRGDEVVAVYNDRVEALVRKLDRETP